MENDDTDLGGEALSVEQAASAYAKAISEGAEQAKPEEDNEIAEAETADDELQASDEDVSEDEEGEPEDEGQSDEEEDDQEPESDQGRFVASNGKVKLPDGTVSTVADLIQGNLRDRDYRQKTMGLGEEKRQLQEQSSAFQATVQQVNEQREYLSSLLQSIAPQPPDPSMLNTDPVGYMQQKAQYEQFAAHYQTIQQQKEAVRQQTEQQTQKQRLERANEEWDRLQGAMPELRDEAKLKSFADELDSTAQAYGFSRQEITEALPYDHRMALVLRDAAKWRKLQASKPKAAEKVKGRPPVQKGGKRLSPDAQRVQRANDAITRLKSTGTVEDAAAAYLASMKG